MLAEQRIDELMDRLDQLEGCEDNPIYAREIAETRDQLHDAIIDLILDEADASNPGHDFCAN